MRTLFATNFNWPVYFVTIIVIRVLFMDISWYSYLAIVISLHQFMLLFDSIAYVIPVRYLLGALMCVQFFIGPMLAYNGVDQYQYFMYRMRIPEADYFAYVLPAVCLFIAGLHLNAGRLKGEVINEERIALFVQRNPTLPYFFIGMGFVTSIVSTFFSSQIAFVFYLLGNFKFIGLFLLVLGTKQIKVLPLIVVMGSIISSSLGDGMFHDLLTWILFTAAIFGIKYKFSIKTKLAGTAGFLLLVITIQLLKSSYREAVFTGSGDAGVETFAKLAEAENEDAGILNPTKLAQATVRINQGFIITNIMVTVPEKEPFSRGKEMYQLFEAGILPRFIAPNKLKAGDRTIFVRYSRIPLQEGTSMGLSSVGDAYINFGVIGGSLFMFFLGLMYSEILNALHRYSWDYPILILFSALIFYYPIRPDCEFQTILGHLFKSCFLIIAIMVIWNYRFRVPSLYRTKVVVQPG